MNRRKFLANSVMSLLVLNSCKNQEIKQTTLVIGKLSDFNEGDNFLDLYRLVIKKKTVDNKIYLTAMSKLCTHQTCLLNNNLECPCHGSVFSSNGNVLKGPAVKNLPYFKLNIDSSRQISVDFSQLTNPEWSLEII